MSLLIEPPFLLPEIQEIYHAKYNKNIKNVFSNLLYYKSKMLIFLHDK